MKPVISPWVFYFTMLSDNVSFVSAILFIIGIIVLITFAIFKAVDVGSGFADEDIQEMCDMVIKKLYKWVVLIGLLSCLLPSEKTITKMIVAQNVTYERVDAATDVVEAVYNDIMALFEDGE